MSTVPLFKAAEEVHKLFTIPQVVSDMSVARFEVFTEMKINVAVFWVVTPCSGVVGYQCFRGPCCQLGNCNIVRAVVYLQMYTGNMVHGTIYNLGRQYSKLPINYA
jgi:hypothetical protein